MVSNVKYIISLSRQVFKKKTWKTHNLCLSEYIHNANALKRYISHLHYYCINADYSPELSIKSGMCRKTYWNRCML